MLVQRFRKFKPVSDLILYLTLWSVDLLPLCALQPPVVRTIPGVMSMLLRPLAHDPSTCSVKHGGRV